MANDKNQIVLLNPEKAFVTVEVTDLIILNILRNEKLYLFNLFGVLLTWFLNKPIKNGC